MVYIIYSRASKMTIGHGGSIVSILWSRSDILISFSFLTGKLLKLSDTLQYLIQLMLICLTMILFEYISETSNFQLVIGSTMESSLRNLFF